MHIKILNLTTSFLFLFLSACSTARIPVPVGDIPNARNPSSEEQSRGNQGYQEISRQFSAVRDPAIMARVKRIVDNLLTATPGDQSPWHLHVLESNDFVNAAATAGNHIYVWKPIIDWSDNVAGVGDAGLAAVIGHEIGHVLAGHVMPTAGEIMSEGATGIAGGITSAAVTGAGYGAIGDLAGNIISQGLKAILINPEQQRQELEADQIGLFLMADAGYDPRAAITFWTKAARDPKMGGGSGSESMAMFSSHPASGERMRRLKEMLPLAQAHWQG